jgi:hypothetical protein
MSSLQVDSISSMGGGHVDGAGKVVQFENAVLETQTTISDNTTATLLTINFTPKLADSLILVQAFHSHDSCGGTADNHAHGLIYVGATLVGRAWSVGFLTTKVSGAGFSYSYSGTIDSWGTTPQAVDLRVTANSGIWGVSNASRPTNLYVWEIAQ